MVGSNERAQREAVRERTDSLHPRCLTVGWAVGSTKGTKRITMRIDAAAFPRTAANLCYGRLRPTRYTKAGLLYGCGKKVRTEGKRIYQTRKTSYSVASSLPPLSLSLSFTLVRSVGRPRFPKSRDLRPVARFHSLRFVEGNVVAGERMAWEAGREYFLLRSPFSLPFF